MPATPAIDVAPPQAFAGCSLASSNGSGNLRPENRQAKPLTFSCIVADPPWRTTTGPGWKVNSGHKKLEYPVMTMPEIKALPVSDLAKSAAHLYLWTTNILVRQAYEVAEAWGFKPSVLLTWAKNPCGMGLGDAFGITTEHVLFAHRGGLRPLRREPTTWWNWKRGKHSAKPEGFIDMVETVSPGPYLEMFARRNRLGWSTWGNQCFEHVSLHTGAVAPAADSQNVLVSNEGEAVE